MSEHEVVTRLALLEQAQEEIKVCLSSLEKDVREMNAKMTSLIISATLSKKQFLLIVSLIGAVWPVIGTILIILTR
jgi:hypothetical protein